MQSNEATVARPRGRPKGSRNKNRIISGATVEDYCKIYKHNPTEFLIRVAKGENVQGIDWSKDDRMRANAKLHDSIHHNKPAGAIGNGQGDDGQQYEIVFIESGENFKLPEDRDETGQQATDQCIPGAANAEGDQGTMPGEPI